IIQLHKFKNPYPVARYRLSAIIPRIGIMLASIKGRVNAYTRKPTTEAHRSGVKLAANTAGTAIRRPIAGNHMRALAFVLDHQSAMAPPKITPTSTAGKK